MRLDEVDKKVRDTVVSQEALTAKISTIEEKAQQFPMFPEAKIEAVIPIKREKVLAPLTETELSVLEMLSLEGPKTAPEIKGKIKLSREHTARLMKKLYESGYLERETSKIPFKYSVKKEMEKLLRKAESKTA
jgi:predicted transcriptional regulator